MQLAPSVYRLLPSVCFHCNFWTEWPMTLIFRTCTSVARLGLKSPKWPILCLMGCKTLLHGIESQGQRSKRGRCDIEWGQFQFCHHFLCLCICAYMMQGGVIVINIEWYCNLDYSIESCLPRYSFSRLDHQDAKIAKGSNFRLLVRLSAVSTCREPVMIARSC